jgi:hypothetical protein
LIAHRSRRIEQRMKLDSLTDRLPGLIKAAKKTDRVVGAVMDFWREQDVPGLDEITKIEYRGGVITVHIPSAAARFMFDRQIRSPEFFRATAEAAPGTVSRIKTKV